MALAIAEAGRGRYTANPNPVVGAVIVRDDRVVATGFHERAGMAHAERVAIDAAGDARGATMYVTLEPCSHHGRTAPCSDAIIQAGLARVVAGTIDPNPRVSGRGIAAMREAGIDVEVGVLGAACWRLNEDFMVAIRTGRPMISAKLAMSLDGRIATRTGDSRWISGEASRQRVHALRRDHHAILVGTNTLLADDPRLTTRIDSEPGARNPIRYVLDAALRAPADARVHDTTHASTTVVCAEGADTDARRRLEDRGVRVLEVQRGERGLDFTAVLADMTARGALSLLVEGGGELVGRLGDAGLIDRLYTFIAPVLIGGAGAKPAMGGAGVDRVDDAPRAHTVVRESLGDDTLITADFSPHLIPPGSGD